MSSPDRADRTVLPEQGTMVEGVGDEVMLMGVASLLLLPVLLTLIVYSKWAGQNHTIHPAQNGPVESARREIGEGVREGGGEGRSAEMEPCPICLSGVAYAVETNCGHVFCAECLLTYWQHDQWPRPARCAVCRRLVTLLLPSRELQSPSAQQLWRRVSDYNHRMSGQPRPLIHYLYDVPILLRHLWRDLFTLRGLVLLYRLHILFILLFLLLYMISPLDIIPEAVVGVIGLLDDLLIFLGVMVYITILYRAHLANP